MVPDEFDLSDNLDTILAVVLDQELQRYNELLEVMKDTLKVTQFQNVFTF